MTLIKEIMKKRKYSREVIVVQLEKPLTRILLSNRAKRHKTTVSGIVRTALRMMMEI